MTDGDRRPPRGTPQSAGSPGGEPMRTALGREVDAGWVRERIYATLTMLAVVVALAAEHVTYLEAAVSVLATAVGVWLTALVAEEQAYRADHGRLAGKDELRRMLYVTSPLLNSAVSPLVLIGVSAVGLLVLSTALYVSAGLDALSLFAWSYYSGLRMGAGVAASSVAGLINISVGAGIIVVKLLAH